MLILTSKTGTLLLMPIPSIHLTHSRVLILQVILYITYLSPQIADWTANNN